MTSVEMKEEEEEEEGETMGGRATKKSGSNQIQLSRSSTYQCLGTRPRVMEYLPVDGSHYGTRGE